MKKPGLQTTEKNKTTLKKAEKTIRNNPGLQQKQETAAMFAPDKIVPKLHKILLNMEQD